MAQYITGCYAPSMNMHRSAFGGRDFEYYSEDSLLSAKMAVAKTKGILDAGMYPFIIAIAKIADTVPTPGGGRNKKNEKQKCQYF